jgi:P4 family phage/plasmid primase-like protien
MIIYDKKNLALNAKKKNEIMYAEDCKRFSICNDYHDFLLVIISKKHFQIPRMFEYIFAKNPVNFFYDIEIKEAVNPVEFNDYINVINVILDKTRFFFSNLGLQVHDLVLESHTTDNVALENRKKSFHVIYRLQKSNYSISFKNVLVCKNLALFLFPKLTSSKIVDVSVYREGCFRTIHSTKINEFRPLIRSTLGYQDFDDIETFIQYTLHDTIILEDKDLGLRKRTLTVSTSTTVAYVSTVPTIEITSDLDTDDKLIITRFLKNEYNYNSDEISSIELKLTHVIVALKDKYCRNIKDFHKNNNQYIIIDTKTSRRKCHDEDCKTMVFHNVEYSNFPYDLQQVIVKIFDVEKIEKESLVVNNELNNVVASQFDDKHTDFNYDRVVKRFISRGDPHLQSFLKSSTCAPGQCNITHNVTNGNVLSFECTICGARYPQEGMQLQLSSVTCPQLTHFWQNNGNIIINNNYYSGEDPFSCDVNLELSLFNNNRELASLHNQILDGHNIAKISELLFTFEDNFKYSNGTWYHFNQIIWEIDEENLKLRHQVIKMSNHFKKIKQFYEAKLANEENTSIVKNIKSLIIKLGKPGFEDDIIKTSKVFYDDKQFVSFLNAKKHLVPFCNGVFDLLTKVFRETVKEDYVNLTFGFDYSPQVRNPEVKAFIENILPVQEVRDYVLKKMSECLNGDIPNTNFLMFIGDGANGKSQLLNLMKLAMGQLAEKVEVTLLTRKRNNANEANTEKIKLMYKRFAFLSEPEDGEKINISLLKELTGSEEIVARGLYESSQTFIMETKLFLACNELPEIKGEDTALWRRIKVVNFPSRFIDDPKDDNEFKIDRSLPSRMREDLTWRQTFVNILIDYYYMEIKEPSQVQAKTNEYRQGNDIVLEFINQMCDLKPGNKEFRIESGLLYDVFLSWISTQDSCTSSIKSKQFKDRVDKITKFNYKQKIYIGKNMVCGWIGIQLKINKI